MEKVQRYREAAGKRELALEEEQINSSAAAILEKKKRKIAGTGRWLKMMYSNSRSWGELTGDGGMKQVQFTVFQNSPVPLMPRQKLL